MKTRTYLLKQVGILIWLAAWIQPVSAQYFLKEVTALGDLQARHVKYYSDTREWVLSDGYYAFKTNSDFSKAGLLFNTYPRYQFSLDRLPNKNYFSRHHDKKLPPFGFEYRANKLDSSAVYVMSDSLKRVNNVSPSAFLQVNASADDGKPVTAWAVNDCFIWGKDSVVICRNGTIGVARKIDNRDSVYTIVTRSQVMSLAISEDGTCITAGTRDSGWYFIPVRQPDSFIRIRLGAGQSANGFYFDRAVRHVWVEVGDDFSDAFYNFTEYDYSKGSPRELRQINAETLGLSSLYKPLFAFDFKQGKLYIKTMLSSLTRVDLREGRVEHDFFGELHQKLSSINQIYYNTDDNYLYLSAVAANSSVDKPQSFLYRIETDSAALSVKIISPSNKQDENKLYLPGIRPVVNRLPKVAYDMQYSLSANGLALLQSSRTEYMLYNISNGNMIRSFQAVNIPYIYNKDRYIRENRATLSPSGHYIFEYMIKAGITSGISDTLYMALTDTRTGDIKRNRMVLTDSNRLQIENLTWNRNGMPVFAQRRNGRYPEKVISSFYLDSLLVPHLIAEYSVSDEVYAAWNIAGTGNMLIPTGKSRDTSAFSLMSAAGKRLVFSSGIKERIEVLTNDTGFGLQYVEDQHTTILWYDTDGNYKNKVSFRSDSFSIKRLAARAPALYLQDSKNATVNRMDLLTGKITALYSRSFMEEKRSFLVDPAESLLLSAGDKQIAAWSINRDSLRLLYTLQAENDFIKFTQLTEKYLVSDGRVWNLETGFMEQMGIAAIAAVGDSQFIKKVNPYELLNDLGRDDRWKTIYRLKPHARLYSKNLAAATDLDKWKELQKNILLTTGSLTTDRIDGIYELPLISDIWANIELYPSGRMQHILVVKKDFKPFDYDIRKSPADTIVLLDLTTGKTDKRFGKITSMKKLPNDVGYIFLLLDQQTGLFQVYRTGKNGLSQIQTNAKFSIDSGYVDIADENKLNYGKNNRDYHYNLQTQTSKEREKEPFRYEYRSLDKFGSASSYDDADEKASYTSYSDGGIVKKMENDTGISCTRYLPPGEKTIVGSNKRYILVLDKTGNYYFVNKKTLEPDLTLYTWKASSFTDREYIWLTKENYYMASAGVEKKIHFVEKSNIIPLKQGDILFNRPDKVLEYLNAPKKEMELYRELYQIRANKYKVQPGQERLRTDLVRLKVEPVISEKEITLKVKALSDNKITSLQVTVNGCPYPVELVSASNRLEQNISIPLNAGNNTIYTWVEDEKGNSSRYDEQKVTGEFKDGGQWHFIGIGVSDYKDQTKNLRYADKDIRDLAVFLKKEYPGIIIDTLLNEAVTNENIKKIADRLKATNPDDKILFSVSGHGMLDDKGKFWYATHDMNFADPAQTGLSMNAITGMLENIPARYRLITLDACHSGEIVTGRVSIPAPAAWVAKDSSVNGRGIVVASRDHSKSSSADLLISMQKVFTDQLSNKGINLIAASSGTEYALEGEDWKNGVFTSALIMGWSFGAREEPGYEPIHYRNLKQYIQRTVSGITGGRQTPNTVMENGEINWWLIPKK